MSSNFDLTPDPRVLQILGEINLDQWKCLAELVDNSVDAFINYRRQAQVLDSPQVLLSLPTVDREDATVTVRDNGPGMTIDQLEKAVRAGWSGNSPLENLGLFGMGFNIATARLGMVTEVYTTRAGDAEWTGLRIDLNELRRTRSYHTPRLTRPKSDHSAHGTEIKVLRLKPEQRAFFAKGANLSKIRTRLSRIYAPLLLAKDAPFSLQINGQNVQPRRPCHWSPERFAQGSDGNPVHVVETFDFSLPARRYCTTCMISLSGNESCPNQSDGCKVVDVKRRLHGWVGLQRYMHEEDFGIDLIRNGRVIEVQNKDLFVWTGNDRPEREYPIDDQRNRGRFIGEVNIDHCRVSYTKDRFERDDPAWSEMVALIRGEGPLQPQKAKALGYPVQDAPLYRLFQAFRRNSPQGKTGRWSRIFAVKNNERAMEMAESFNKGDPDYQTDEKWFELIEEEDKKIVGGGLGPTAPGNLAPVIPVGFLDEVGTNAGTVPPGPSDQTQAQWSASVVLPPRQKVHELTRVFKHPLLKLEFNVESFIVQADDAALNTGLPWSFKLDDPGTRTFLFLFHKDHIVFRSVTLTPLDALLCELTVKIVDFLSGNSPTEATFAGILSELRREYAKETDLEPRNIIFAAEGRLKEIAASVSSSQNSDRFQSIFDGLDENTKEAIRHKIASAGVITVQGAIGAGDFLSYAPLTDIKTFVGEHPELFFDGKFWDEPFTNLDYGSHKVNEEARQRVLERYMSYLADVTWLASQSPRDLDRCERDELIRASLSIRIISPDGPV